MERHANLAFGPSRLGWILILFWFLSLTLQGAPPQNPGGSGNGPPGPVGNPTPKPKSNPPQSNPTPPNNPAPPGPVSNPTPGAPQNPEGGGNTGTGGGTAPGGAGAGPSPGTGTGGTTTSSGGSGSPPLANLPVTLAANPVALAVLEAPLTTLTPKAKVALRAPNASNLLSSSSRVSLADLANIRSILLDKIGYGAPALGLWAAAHSDFVKEEGSSEIKTAGLLVALDKTLTSTFLAGLCAGFNHSWNPTLMSDGGFGGAYGTFKAGHFYATDTAIAGASAFTTTRTGLLGVAKANANAFFATNVIQAGANYSFNHFELGPFASFTYAFSANQPFTESGSAANLRVSASNAHSLVSDLGLHASVLVRKVALATNLSWEHEFTSTTSFSTVALADIPNSTTTISGPSLGHEALLFSEIISVSLSSQASLSLSYDTTLIRKNYSSNSISLGIKIHF
jgi:outer membrane autotransporter protein